MEHGNPAEVLQSPVVHVVALEFPPEQAVAGVAGVIIGREHEVVPPVAAEPDPGTPPAETDLPTEEKEALSPQSPEDVPEAHKSTVEEAKADKKPAQTPVVRGHNANFSGYLVKIGEEPLLTADEECELAQIIERGREAQDRIDMGENSSALRQAVRAAAAARDRFIRANLRLVVSVARRYRKLPPGTTIEDIVQEGNLGLEHAVEKFKWRKGFKFSTYATFWIRQAIGRYLDEKSTLVHIPGAKASSLRQAFKRVNDDSQLTEEESRIDRLTRPLHLDGPINDDNDDTLSDVIPETNAVATEEAAVDNVTTTEQRKVISNLLDLLSDRQRWAVELRFGLDCGLERTNREVGEIMGISPDSVGGLLRRAKEIMRAHAEGRDEEQSQF